LHELLLAVNLISPIVAATGKLHDNMFPMAVRHVRWLPRKLISE